MEALYSFHASGEVLVDLAFEFLRRCFDDDIVAGLGLYFVWNHVPSHALDCELTSPSSRYYAFHGLAADLLGWWKSCMLWKMSMFSPFEVRCTNENKGF